MNNSSRSMRILHCPNLIGGNPPGLARAERELGIASYCVAFQQNYLQYPVDEVLHLDQGKLRERETKRWRLLWRAIKEFDIIHFNFGETILPKDAIYTSGPINKRDWLYRHYARLFELRDLPLLKLAKKGIVVTYQGDDARQGDFSRAKFAISIANEVGPDYYSPETDRRKRIRIAQFAKYADRIFALNPDLLHVLPVGARFMPYGHIDLSEWQPIVKPITENQPPVVLHAPSHRGAKGTRFVMEAVDRLQREGIPFEFVLVEGLSHAEARKLYERADLLIDQLLAGWYGGLAVELMALGKPVICYLREEDLKFIPSAMCQELPLIQATPTTLYETLKLYLTTRRAELSNIGQRSRSYVEHWHDPLKIAGQLKTEYEAILASKHLKRVF